MTILLTGYKPFLDNKTNPSKGVSLFLDGYKGCVVSKIFPVSYSRMPLEFEKAVHEINPDIILCLGLHSKAKNIHLEKCAYNLLDASYPDGDGIYKSKEKIDDDGEEILSTELDLSLLEKKISDAKIPVEISLDPGRYLCNHIYYLALTRTKKALFIHLPPENILTIEKDEEALKIIIDALIDNE